jgi:hypothetical protein
MPLAPIGGQLISSFGGALGFAPYQGNLPAAGAPPPVTWQTLLDVAGWEMERVYADDDTTHTGSWGNEGHNVTRMGFRLAAEVLWDLYAPPNFIVANGHILNSLIAPSPDLGYRFWAYVGDDADCYYFAPSVKASSCKTIVNMDGSTMVRARIDVIGNGPVFALGGTLTEQPQYDLYIAHCMTRNWGW